MASSKPIEYKDAGVDIDEADRAVALIRSHARKTFTKSVKTDIGSFGAGYLLQGCFSTGHAAGLGVLRHLGR